MIFRGENESKKDETGERKRPVKNSPALCPRIKKKNLLRVAFIENLTDEGYFFPLGRVHL